MVTFLKEAQYKALLRRKGVKRAFKTARARMQADLRAYAVLLDVIAKSVARAQGRKIVQKAHVEIAVEILKNFSK